ncbi:hypothetical protein GC105_13935 [Alkalibaculum sp. M08DMB]|uniref:Lipoprotein n=1 Tax=Alkalibaculum sporogenes TaxID=2655001 RepID=A0A6A7KC02_9FIRM|nr:hypothetical protein [Alkalibaculum sporogenes]MPW26882.1 hypothetical protein [Alkalibaculum sporogenes]
MRKNKLNKLIIFFYSFLVLIVLVGCSFPQVKNIEDLNFNNLNSVLSDYLNELKINSQDLRIINKNLNGFDILFNKDNGNVIFLMTQLYEEGNKNNYKVIDIEYNSNQNTISKYEVGNYKFSEHPIENERVKINDLLNCLHSIDVHKILSPYNNINTDFYEIKTDGIYREMGYKDLNPDFRYLILDNNILAEASVEQFENKQSLIYCLPIYFGVGNIQVTEEGDVFNNNNKVVVLVNR